MHLIRSVLKLEPLMIRVVGGLGMADNEEYTLVTANHHLR